MTSRISGLRGPEVGTKFYYIKPCSFYSGSRITSIFGTLSNKHCTFLPIAESVDDVLVAGVLSTERFTLGRPWIETAPESRIIVMNNNEGPHISL